MATAEETGFHYSQSGSGLGAKNGAGQKLRVMHLIPDIAVDLETGTDLQTLLVWCLGVSGSESECHICSGNKI